MPQASRAVVRATSATFMALAIVGCCHHGPHHDEPGLGVLNDARFRSFTLLPISAPDGNRCEKSRFQDPEGKRPLCAVTQWTNNQCVIVGLQPNTNCKCFEGQAHACHEVTQGTCQAGAPSCGIRACLVNSDADSQWSQCSLL